jgi:8-oxo-dGTP pyrophosphatase MutT (NUDIX family)
MRDGVGITLGVTGALAALGMWATRGGAETGRPGAGMVVVKPLERRALLLRRGPTDPWRPGWWNLPGGGIEPGEAPLEGARRETLEEAGLRVGRAKLVHKILGPGWFFCVFATTDWSGDVQIDFESDDFAWVTAEEARSYQTLPGVQESIEKAMRSV